MFELILYFRSEIPYIDQTNEPLFIEDEKIVYWQNTQLIKSTFLEGKLWATSLSISEAGIFFAQETGLFSRRKHQRMKLTLYRITARGQTLTLLNLSQSMPLTFSCKFTYANKMSKSMEHFYGCYEALNGVILLWRKGFRIDCKEVSNSFK